MYSKFTVIALWTAWLALGAESSVARGDGGAVRFHERRGDRLITVFTSPTPLCAGPVDISVLVQDAHSGRPLRDQSIMVHAYPPDHARSGRSALATPEAATNKLLCAAQLDLPDPGRWHVELTLEGLGQGRAIGFEVEVARAQSTWRQMSLWIGWPFAVIGLFLIHQLGAERHRLRLAMTSETFSVPPRVPSSSRRARSAPSEMPAELS